MQYLYTPPSCCPNCPWQDALQQRSKTFIAPTEKLQLVGSTLSSIGSQQILDRQPEEMEEGVLQDWPSSNQEQLSSDVKIQNIPPEDKGINYSQKNYTQNFVNAALKEFGINIKTKGRPKKNQLSKIRDFNKYFARKIMNECNKDFSDFWNARKTLNNQQFRKVLSQCKESQLKNVLQLMIMNFQKKKQRKSNAKELPFNRDRLDKQNVVPYLRYSQKLLQVLNREKKK